LKVWAKISKPSQEIVSTAVFVTPPCEADMVAVVDSVTFTVLTVKVTEVRPAGMVTDFGRVAADWLLDRATTSPPVGAAPLRVTVPVEDLPPATLVGLNVRDVSVGGLTVSDAVCELPFRVPVIVAWVAVATAVDLTVKFAVLFPDATVTDAGTVTAFWLLDSLTTKPAFGAGPESVKVPVAEAPPSTEDGLTLTDWITVGLTMTVTA